MKSQTINRLTNRAILFFLFLAIVTPASATWFDCVPYRVAARNSGDVHIGCSNIGGWYFVTKTSKNQSFIDRALYLGTTAIVSNKSLKLDATPGRDSAIIGIEVFK